MYIKQAGLITFTDLGKLFTLMPPHREVIAKEQSMNIKLLAAAAALTLSAAAFASPAVTLDYAHWQARAGGENGRTSGVGIGIEQTSESIPNGFYGRFEYGHSSKSDADFYEVQAGYSHNFVQKNGLYLNGKIGMGYAVADVKRLRNRNNFLTLPIGAEAGWQSNGGFGVYAGLGYKWAFDLTSENSCADGWQSNSNGRGTCSHHGGISHANDKMGTVKGATANVGLRYSF